MDYDRNYAGTHQIFYHLGQRESNIPNVNTDIDFYGYRERFATLRNRKRGGYCARIGDYNARALIL